MNHPAENELSKLYPHLVLRVHERGYNLLKEEVVAVWVKRDGRSGEAAGTEILLNDPDLHAKLKHYEEQSVRALQPGYFYCTGHTRAEPESEYDFFHFAAKYCREYGEEHPEVKVQAENENYR